MMKQGKIMSFVIYTILFTITITIDGRYIKQKDVTDEDSNASSYAAFSAHRTTDLLASGSSVTVTYDKILLNDGNHFNEATGVFTAPVKGVYVFTCHTQSNGGSYSSLIKVYYGSGSEAIHFHEQIGHHNSGNSFMVELSAGQGVWMELQSGYMIGNYGHPYTSFTGHLLYTKA